jgi:2-polyprenyl-3-methyl-5-hydroxy-6-metoxy-1,4-benzoquinol methylase
MDLRLQHEIEHGRYLLTHGAGKVWNWETPAGRVRWRRRVAMLAGDLQPGMHVLELGCGTGYFTRELARTGASITAVDISPELLAIALQQYQADSVRFEVQNAYALSYLAESYDAVVGSSILHHLDVRRASEEIYRVLRPHGIIRFTEPNMLNPQIAIQKNVPAIKRRLGDSPDETAFFRWSLRRQLGRVGFANVQIRPFDFLHPQTPRSLIPVCQLVGDCFERVPLVSEFAGSLYIAAHKPA